MASPVEHLQPSSSSSSTRSSSGKATTKEPTSLTIQVLKKITNNFSEERAIGQGAFGKVYKGIFENGEEIAVKILYNNMQAIDDEKFKLEFDNLMMLKHKNIVQLVGYCYETQRQHMEFKGKIVFGETTYRALCFEYMNMGSLQRHLSDETQGLDWQIRYEIIKGVCEGLKYLHEGFKEPIYHLDLKPDNILLDQNMVPKLADFGLSKLFGEEQTRVTQSSTGTIGYMPREYLFGQVVSKKFDIFSLGVIITQIIAGPKGPSRSDDISCQEFLNQVNENWRTRLEATCASEVLEANCEQVSICTEIGLKCMDMDRHKRPNVGDIIQTLNEAETQEYQLLKSEESPRSFKEISDTLLEIIVTMYDHETERYASKARDREREYMLEKLNKVLIEHSRELIRKIQRNTSEQFKGEYVKNIKNMKETDADVNHVHPIVNSCVAKFMNACEDLMVLDSEYLHKTFEELQKDLHSFSIYHILTIKEIRETEETELAHQRLEKNIEELLKIYDEMIHERRFRRWMLLQEERE